MRRSRAFILLLAASLAGAAAPDPRGKASGLRFVTDEAEAALALLAIEEQGRVPAEADWQRLFASEGYRRLKARETAFHRPFTEEALKAFVASAAAEMPIWWSSCATLFSNCAAVSFGST